MTDKIIKTLEEYSTYALETVAYPNAGSDIMYAALGLAGEGGEVANKVKKLIRDYKAYSVDELSPENREKFVAGIMDELGDVMWYVNAMAYECGISLEQIATRNIAKLSLRYKTGKIGGEGDDR